MTRPRVVDDFSTIRARIEELCRARAQVLVEARSRSVIHPRPYHRAASTSPSMKAVSIPSVTSGPELSGGWIRYCTAPRGPDPNPLLLAILRSSPMMERKPRAREALPPGMMPPWELRR